MSVQPLMSRLRDLPAIDALISHRVGRTTAVVPSPLHVPVIAAAISNANASGVVLVVTPSSRESDQVRDTLRTLIDPSIHVWDFPSWETLPHERLSPHPETVARRLSVLRALGSRRSEDSPLVVVASVRSLIQPVNTELSSSPWLRLEKGHYDGGIEGLSSGLVALAYQRVDLVTGRVEFAVRGGIGDVFPALEDHPVRADFFGDEIDELTSFAVADQRSLSAVDSVDVPPAREMLLTDSLRSRAKELAHEYPGVGTMLEKIANGIPVDGMESLQPALAASMGPVTDFFPDDTLIVELQPERARSRARALIETNREFLEAAWETAAAGASERPIDFHL
ncbi:MAG: transcription-repair coupling factor, partial [Pontimonas sp.]